MLDVQKGQVNMKLNKIKLVILAAAMAVNTLGVTAIAAEPVEETTEQQIMPDIYESFGMEFGHFEDNRELDKYDYDPSDDILMTYVAEPFPLAEYPANTSYFNKDGTVPCTCHIGQDNDCNPSISCDCNVISRAQSCCRINTGELSMKYSPKRSLTLLCCLTALLMCGCKGGTVSEANSNSLPAVTTGATAETVSETQTVPANTTAEAESDSPLLRIRRKYRRAILRIWVRQLNRRTASATRSF